MRWANPIDVRPILATVPWASTAAPRSGALVEAQGTVAKIGRTSLGLAQRMSDPRDGRPFAELRQLGVHFDKDARRPAAMPEALLAGMRRLQTRGE